jgi:UDP-GlcNAc3NAcA epimerase
MRIFSVVGARPQFVKLATIAKAMQQPRFAAVATHGIIHTGQHYDWEMSEAFFADLGIARPAYLLEVGSKPHGEQTGEMMKRLEPVLMAEKPDWVVVYGDTNSTLAAALVAAKLGQRIAHVEAGLRSYNRAMPEEINRIVADHVSDLLLCPTAAAMTIAAKEGMADKAVLTGDVMLDAVLQFREIARSRPSPELDSWQPKQFALATIHRAENTDDPVRLLAILQALERIAATICPVVLPLHPRTRNVLAGLHWEPKAITLTKPASYLEMLLLEDRARFILTDSGGVQKEAYFFQTPCITMRDETEWVETLENGCNTLTGADGERIFAAASAVESAGPWKNVYGNGDAAERSCEAMLRLEGAHG